MRVSFGCLLMFPCLLIAAPYDVDNLLSVIVLIRHGDRNVIDPYPNDPYKDVSYWPGGYGQLTNQGKQREFQTGEWFRNRYRGFVSEEYSVVDTYVKSSNPDRNLMSAASFLAGFYYTENNQTWGHQLHWQPVPIHSAPRNFDNMLGMLQPCPKHDRLMEELWNSTSFKTLTKKLGKLYDYLSSNAGREVRSVVKTQYLYDNLLMEDMHHWPLPDWTKTVYPKPMVQIAGFYFATESYTTELTRLKSGPFFNEVVQHFSIASKYNSTVKPYQRMRFYFGHDTTIADVLMPLKLYDFIPPPFAAAVIFELRESPSGSVYVNILYRNTTEEPVKLTANGCDYNCDFDKFVDIVKPVTVTQAQWEKECYEK